MVFNWIWKFVFIQFVFRCHFVIIFKFEQVFSLLCIHCSLISGWSDSNSIWNPIRCLKQLQQLLQIQVYLHLLKKNYSTIRNFKRSLRSIIGNWTFALNIFLTIKHPTATRTITMLKFIAIKHDKSIWPLKKLQFVAIFRCPMVKVRISKQKALENPYRYAIIFANERINIH